MGASRFNPGYGAVLGKSAAVLADLATFSNTPNGVGAYVISRGRIYWSVPVGRGDVAGTGNDWKSDWTTSDPAFRAQPWFVDPAGSDDNTGLDVGHPIATIGELVNRWGPSPVVSATTITLASGNYGLLQQTLSFATAQTADQVIIVGTPSAALASGTVNTYTAPSTVTNRMYLLKANGLPGNDWTPYVGKRVRFTVSGAVCFVLLANPFGLGNDTAEITQVSTLPIAPNYSSIPFAPGAGIDFVVEDLPFFDRLSIALQSSPSQTTDNTFKAPATVAVLGINCTFYRVSTASIEAPSIRTWGSSFQSLGDMSGMGGNNSTIFQSCFINVDNFYLPGVNYIGCGFKTQNPGVVSSIIMNFWASLNSCTFEGVGLSIGYGGGFMFNCGAFNSTVDGVATNAQAAPLVVSGYLLGSGNVRGMTINNGTIVNKIGGFANMKITGIAGDWRFGAGAMFAWSDAPRAQNYGSFSGQLAGGTFNVPITNLPADANCWATARVVSGVGATGVLTCPAQTTAQVTISSAVATETSTFAGGWNSPSSPAGGVFSV